jgi:glycosyltransferase involved in cell wall biosynthesis
MKKLSIIVPCYNEEQNVKLFYKECLKTFKNYGYKIEIIFINDGSKDNTYKEIQKIIKQAKSFSVKGINFSRNFGKDAAVYAGMENSTGDYAVVIDADLQQKPQLIKEMLNILEENYDIDEVCYYQEKRIENKIIGFLKSKFYKFITKVSDIDFVNGASDFRLFRRNVIDTMLSMSERNRFSKGIFSWIGFNIYYLPYIAEERQNGTSSFNFVKLFKYAFNGIISFSSYPIKLILNFGITITFLSLVYFSYFITRLILNMNVFKYWILFGILFLLFGILFISIGAVGMYIYNIHLEVKHRPIYVKKEILDGGKKYEE